MLQLKKIYRIHQITLKEFCRDSDKSNCGRVGFGRLRAILDMLGIQISGRQFQILCNVYNYQKVEFNYPNFVKDLES